MQTTKTTVAPFTCITHYSESEHTTLLSALRQCVSERLNGRGGDVCGPQGWVHREGRLIGGRHDWEVLEIGYDEGRGQIVLHGYNRCAEVRHPGDCLFTWNVFRGQPLDTARFGFSHARVTDRRALPLLKMSGVEI